jgi:putative aldouronate transport system substrate-binding protein
MKHPRTILLTLIMLAMTITLFAGCSSQVTTAGTTSSTGPATTVTKATTSASGINYDSMFPVTREKVELEFCIRYTPAVIGKWENLWFWHFMQQRTNITVVPRLVADDVWEEQKAIILASGDLPDVFFVDGWTNAEVYNYGVVAKVFIPITQYVNDTKLMPNLNAALDMPRFATARADSILPDGNIYGLPTLMSEYYVTASGIRAHWLNDQLLHAGIDYRTIKTLDDFYYALVAVRDDDYNGNGQKDEIGWSSYWGQNGNIGMSEVVAYILNAYHVITSDGLIAVDHDTNEAGYAPLMPQYKDAIVFLNRLYAEKLLDQDLFSQTETDMTAKYAAELVSFSTYWNPGITGSKEQWDRHIASGFDNSVLSSQVPLVAKAEDKPMTWSASRINPNNFILSRTCKYPEAAMRWADACYDPVIAAYYRIGPEYKSADDDWGVGWVYLPEVTWGDSWAQALKDRGEDFTGWQYIQMHVGSAASVGYFGMDEMLGCIKLHPDYNSKAAPQWTYPYETYIQPYEVLGYPNVYYVAEDNRIIELYKAALDEYVIQMTAKFISGQESLDNWEVFQTQLKALNAEVYDHVLRKAFVPG